MARPAIIIYHHNGKHYDIGFEVLDLDVPSILELPTYIQLNLIRHINAVQEQNAQDSNTTNFFEKYKAVCDGLGCISDVLRHISFDPSCEPVIHPPRRRVPIKLQPQIQEELKRMEHLNVVEKVTTPTPWVNLKVTIIKPNGTLRICIQWRI